MRNAKNILIAPLNWGLGHAARCIPIIKNLQAQGHHIIIASDGMALELLKKEINDAIFEKLPAYNITYSKRPWFNKWHLLMQATRLKKIVKQEQLKTRQLIDKHQIDVLISDNRFGVYDPRVQSIYITHQLRVLSGWSSFISTYLHQQIYQKFHEIWIPDFAGQTNLSGRLGHVANSSLNLKYIGPLSRIKIKKTTLKYDVLAILSGPEPQRSLLEKKLIEQLAVLPVKSAIVQGKIDKKTNIKNYGNIDIYNYVNASALEYLINSSDKIIARSGYTSIMDLISMQKPVLWIPTPGQDEQKYLARHIHQKFGYQYTTQAKISLDIDLLDNLPATNFSLFSKKPVKLI